MMKIPEHIAFIMDGNGRWAQAQGKNRSVGHKAGYEHIPDELEVDLIVRTGGDKRISNFLLWQSAYACLFVVDNYWPAITRQDIENAIDYYNQVTVPT